MRIDIFHETEYTLELSFGQTIYMDNSANFCHFGEYGHQTFEMFSKSLAIFFLIFISLSWNSRHICSCTTTSNFLSQHLKHRHILCLISKYIFACFQEILLVLSGWVLSKFLSSVFYILNRWFCLHVFLRYIPHCLLQIWRNVYSMLTYIY